MGWSFLILLLGVCGFSLSGYIHLKKRHDQPLVCPLKSNCHAVISSEYSKFFGIPVEKIGMTYYGAVVLGYAVSLASPAPVIANVLMPVTALATLFSLYLTFIQFFSLKQLCTWCLVSAMFCLAIFGIALSQSRALVTPLLGVVSAALVAVFALAIVLNVALTSRRLRR